MNTETKKHFYTGHNGMREIDGFIIDAIGSETGDMEAKRVQLTNHAELSIVHEGSWSSVRIEQGNIMIEWVCIARSMIDQGSRNRLAALLYRCNGLRA